MREIRPSGSEGGVALCAIPTPMNFAPLALRPNGPHIPQPGPAGWVYTANNSGGPAGAAIRPAKIPRAGTPLPLSPTVYFNH